MIGSCVLLRREAPVHHEDRPGEESGQVAGQVGEKRGDFLGRGDPADRVIVAEHRPELVGIARRLGRAMHQGGVDGAEADGIDPDAVGSVLDRHLSRQLMERTLRGGVRTLARDPDLSRDRPRIQDHPEALLDHDRDDVPGGQEHRFHVGVHDGVPFLGRVLVQRLDDAHRGIVHEDVDPAGEFEGKPGEVACRLLARDITADITHLARGTQRTQCLRFGRDIDRHDVRPGLDITPHRRQADAGGGTR